MVPDHSHNTGNEQETKQVPNPSRALRDSTTASILKGAADEGDPV
jgi:hypothetical protein